MSRGQSHLISLFRNRTRQKPNTQIRILTAESRDSESKALSYPEMAKTISTIMRARPRWQQTLVSDFPSFNFADPLFFRELLKSQNNVLFSLWFFRWLCSNYDYTPDPVSLNLLFGALLDAKAVKAAKAFLHTNTDFKPEPILLEQYVKCLSEKGFADEAIKVYTVLKEMRIIPSIATCNSLLLGCLKTNKLDRFWELHEDMIESEVDLERVRCLIQALCDGGEVSEGYELLKQLLKQGLDPGHDVYAKLISRFCQIENYACMSELLHTMIAWNHLPTIYTYQVIIKGLCKNKQQLEASRIFNNLKDKGYALDRVMYTTMIHGFWEMGWFGSARKLWFEMVNIGMRPYVFTYSEMLRNGYGETTDSCNRMISGFCSHGKSDEAYEIFKKMSETGIKPGAFTYNALIEGFCKENKIEKAMELFKELKTSGLKPSGATYAALRLMISGFCSHGKSDEAEFFKKMSETGVKLDAFTYNLLIQGLCKENRIEKAMELFKELKTLGLKPSRATLCCTPTEENS